MGVVNDEQKTYLVDLRAKSKQLAYLEDELADLAIEAQKSGLTFEATYRAQIEGRAEASDES